MRTLDTATSPLAQAIRDYESELAEATDSRVPTPTIDGLSETERNELEQRLGLTLPP